MKKIISLVIFLSIASFAATSFAETIKVYDIYGREISNGIRLEDANEVEIQSKSILERSLQSEQARVDFKPYQIFHIGSWPEVVAISDLNNDGYNDVVIATSFYFDPENDNYLHVFTQNATNEIEFTDKYPTGRRPISIDAGDLNNDDLTDVVVGNFDSYTLYLHKTLYVTFC